MRRIALGIIILALFSCSLLWAEEIPLSLEEALALGLRENRDITLKAEDVKKAQAKIAEAHADLFPSLSFTGGWTYTRGYYTKDMAQETTQFNAKQTLYQGGKVINTIRNNEHGVIVAQAVLDRARLETAQTIKKAYLTLILANELAVLNQGIVDNTKEHLAVLMERYKNGQASESEILKIQASLEGVQQAHKASLHQVESSQNILGNVLNLDKQVKIRAASPLDSHPQEVAYDAAFLKAMESRPEIKQYAAQVKMAEGSVEIAKADSRPTVYASWDYYSRSHALVSTINTKNWNDYNVIGLTFSWPVFDGWSAKAKVEQAIVDLKEAQLLKDKTSKDIALEVRNAYLALKSALLKLEAQDAEMRVYADNLASAEKKYKAGEVSSLDISDAKLKEAVSVFNKKQALYDYLIAKSSFEKATGGM